MAVEFVVHFDLDGHCFGRNAAGLADCGVGFQKAKTVLEFDIERVLPAKIARVLDTGESSLAKELLELNGMFRRRPCFWSS